MAILTFNEGTILIECEKGEGTEWDFLSDFAVFDERVNLWRAHACKYEQLMRTCYAKGLIPVDHAKDYLEFTNPLKTDFQLLPHQRKALSSWVGHKCRGVVVLPTGSGKTFLALNAISIVKRSALVVVPTIDLLYQWVSILERSFSCEVGMLGGGSNILKTITVSTYDSAVLRMPFLGNKFGLLIYDECHHLTGDIYRTSALLSLAPYRLGLTATFPEEQVPCEVITNLIGPVVHKIGIRDLQGGVLSDYRTERIALQLTPEEKIEYEKCHEEYVSFVRRNHVSFQSDNGWKDFLLACAVRPDGKNAYQAYLKQRNIARCGRMKLLETWRIIQSNPHARIIVFTADNATAYQIGNLLCLPVLTHKTKAAERKDFLERFRSGEYPVLVTGKVLNEGVDVPEANIAIVVSGSGCVREHIQRLGRILRRGENKEAVLYELVSDGTSEMGISNRRRNNEAYDG